MKLQQIVAYINLLDSLSMDSECREAVQSIRWHSSRGYES
jgi:hypothetical protein